MHDTCIMTVVGLLQGLAHVRLNEKKIKKKTRETVDVHPVYFLSQRTERGATKLQRNCILSHVVRMHCDKTK